MDKRERRGALILLCVMALLVALPKIYQTCIAMHDGLKDPVKIEVLDQSPDNDTIKQKSSKKKGKSSKRRGKSKRKGNKGAENHVERDLLNEQVEQL